MEEREFVIQWVLARGHVIESSNTFQERVCIDRAKEIYREINRLTK